MGIFEDWKLTPAELNEIMAENPSLKGFTFGYVCEYKVRKIWFSDKRVSEVIKYNDHDRTRKGDISFIYKGVRLSVEVKSLQTNSLKNVDDHPTGKFQCDASDSRIVTLPSGDRLKTTCLLVGEFDILAVSLFQFKNEWIFGFAKNSALPRSNYNKYSNDQKNFLLATSMSISDPIQPPFYLDPFPLLDEIVEEKKTKGDKNFIIIERKTKGE